MVSLNQVQVPSNCKAGENSHFKTFTHKVAVSKKPADTSVDQACMGFRAWPGPKTAVKVHAGENEGGSRVSVHCIQAAKEGKSCQGAKTEPWEKVITFINLLLPVIYFSPFVTPKTAVLLLERLHIPELVLHR